MYSDISGESPTLLKKTKRWFEDIFGLSSCKETSSTISYKLVYETSVGGGYCTECNKPVTFYSSIPEEFWRIDQYSLGVKLTSKKGRGIKAFFGTNSGIGWFNSNGGTTISSSISGRIGLRQSINHQNGYYSFEQTSINTPEILALGFLLYYGYQYLSEQSMSPNPTTIPMN